MSLPLEIAWKTTAPAFRPTSCRISSIPSSPPSLGNRARPRARGQDHRRPRRHHRMRLAPAADRVPCPDADGRQRNSDIRDMLKTMAKGNILIADDDAAIRTVLNQALARAGYAPARHRQRSDALALDQPRGGGSRHHRRADAGRERLRPHPAGEEAKAGAADHRDERAEHLHDRDHRGRDAAPTNICRSPST